MTVRWVENSHEGQEHRRTPTGNDQPSRPFAWSPLGYADCAEPEQPDASAKDSRVRPTGR